MIVVRVYTSVNVSNDRLLVKLDVCEGYTSCYVRVYGLLLFMRAYTSFDVDVSGLSLVLSSVVFVRAYTNVDIGVTGRLLLGRCDICGGLYNC